MGTKYLFCGNKIISCGNKILYWGNKIKKNSRMALLISHRKKQKQAKKKRTKNPPKNPETNNQTSKQKSPNKLTTFYLQWSNKNTKFWYILVPEGRKPIDKVIYDWKEIETKYSFIEAGHYKPTNCTPHQSVAIIVFVYKEVGSEIQFKIFLNNVIPKLRRQQLEFSIYVVRQQVS